jgi:hypothetical protein
MVGRCPGEPAIRALAHDIDRLALLQGIGIWGVNSTIVWGVAIANYVWWIGIGTPAR